MLPACRTAGDIYAIPQFDIESRDVEGFLDELRDFHAAFRACFARSEPREHFWRSMLGQFSALERKSIEPIAMQTEASSVRAMQRWISDVSWHDTQMLATYHQLGAHDMGAPDGVLIVDETGFPKKGKDAVGVVRQYWGSMGKVEHCQGGGFAAYASRQGYALGDQRLFLPEPWFTEASAPRRMPCAVPAEVPGQTKPQLAAAMVRPIYGAGGLPFRDVVADCRSGNSPDFWEACEACVGAVVVLAMPADTRCGLQPLAPQHPT